MSKFRELTNASQLDYSKLVAPGMEERLVPVIAVDALRLATDGLAVIRMVGFANRAAVEQTLQSGQATFFSRTKSGLWTKGEGSGNFLEVRAAYTDCDADTVLLDTRAEGPTCHTGTDSCFEQPIIGE